METRTKLIIVLCGIVGMVVLVLAILVYSLVSPSESIAPANRVEEAQTKVVERKNPWASQGPAVIEFVKSLQSVPPLFPKAEEEKLAAKKKGREKGKKEVESETPEEEQPTTYGEIMQDKKFVEQVLKMRGTPVGWTADWWGKTKYGQSYYLVQYTFKDGLVEYGPEWLVDLKKRKVKPVNVLAEIVDNPKQAMESKYYDKEAQIISAIASHRFENKMSLAGALLIYFEQQEGSDTENDILGWTVVHVRKNIFRAYFQWTAKKVPQYAEFEFDYDEKKLKPVNFQAAEIMKVGENFDRKRVDIMPQSYDPEATNPSKRWLGPVRKACSQPSFRENCDAFATMLSQKEIIESVEWLLTAREEQPGEFDKCQEARNCAWKPVKNGPNDFTITYEYKLNPADKEPGKISWHVKPKEKEITATDSISRLALKSIRPQ